MSDSKKTFKISELPQISTIDYHDLLLISDFDGAGKNGTTKKMQVQQISQFVVNHTKPVISAVVNQVLDNVLPDMIDEAVQDALSGDIQQMIDESISSYMSSPEFNDKLIRSLDYISDGKTDEQIIIDGGGHVYDTI